MENNLKADLVETMLAQDITPSRAYLLQKIQELEYKKVEKAQEYKRLEAQRNELNSQGSDRIP